MEQIEIELQEGVKIVLSKEKVLDIVLEKFGLKNLAPTMQETETTKASGAGIKPAHSRKGKGKNIQQVMAFLEKNSEISGPDLTKIMGKGGQSYIFMERLVKEGKVYLEENSHPKNWIYTGETGFEKQAEEMSERISKMQKGKTELTEEHKTCKRCKNTFYKPRHLTNYMWKIKKYCGKECQSKYNNEKLKAKTTKPTTQTYTKHKDVRVSKKKHCMTKLDVFKAVKNLDKKGLNSDVKGIARELNYYSNNTGRIATHLWSLKKEGLVVLKDASKRGAGYTAKVNEAKAKALSKKLGIKKVVVMKGEPEEKSPSVGWVRETLDDDRAYYLIESCIYGRKTSFKDAQIIGIVNTQREWDKFGANILRHSNEISEQYNIKGQFRWINIDKTLTFQKK